MAGFEFGECLYFSEIVLGFRKVERNMVVGEFAGREGSSFYLKEIIGEMMDMLD
jgi:hypothetical protein